MLLTLDEAGLAAFEEQIEDALGKD